MKIQYYWLVLAAIVSMLHLGTSYSSAEGKRLALVIGVNKYENLSAAGQLKTAVNDADAVGSALKQIAFDDVKILHNVSRSSFLEELYAFGSRLSKGDLAVFYFAGHGVNFGQNYYLPFDIPAPRSSTRTEEQRMASSAIGEKEIIQALSASGASVVFAIFDACRDNPLNVDGDLSRSVGNLGGVSLDIRQPKGVAVLYSAGYGQRALDRLTGEDPDDPKLKSVFTRYLVKELVRPGQGVRSLADNMKIQVEEAAAKEQGHEQLPAYYDQMTGDFALNDAAKSAQRNSFEIDRATLPSKSVPSETSSSVPPIPTEVIRPPSSVDDYIKLIKGIEDPQEKKRLKEQAERVSGPDLDFGRFSFMDVDQTVKTNETVIFREYIPETNQLILNVEKDVENNSTGKWVRLYKYSAKVTIDIGRLDKITISNGGAYVDCNSGGGCVHNEIASMDCLPNYCDAVSDFYFDFRTNDNRPGLVKFRRALTKIVYKIDGRPQI